MSEKPTSDPESLPEGYVRSLAAEDEITPSESPSDTGPSEIGWDALLEDVERKDETDLPEQLAKSEELKSELLYEPLTGLYNLMSSAGASELRKRLELASRLGDPPRVVFNSFDIDGLKPANTLYGKRNANALLGVFGEVLEECSRAADFPFREGSSGDEFGIVFIGLDMKKIPEKLRGISDKFVKRLEEFDDDPRFSNAVELPKNVMSFSAGICEVSGGLVVGAEDDRGHFEYEDIFAENGVQQRAEEMYELAKDKGGNRYVMEGMTEPVVIREGFVPPKREAFSRL
jgi:GGDEF domain-containing protein